MPSRPIKDGCVKSSVNGENHRRMTMGEKSRRETWDAIEWKHFGQCMWQQRLPNGKGLLEGRLHKATGRIFVVEKFYENKLPRSHTSKPWPELETVNVYAPVDAEGVTWDGLDVALTQFGEKKAA
jgi:hypothetical protein